MTPRREFRDYLQDILETMDKVERCISPAQTSESYLDEHGWNARQADPRILRGRFRNCVEDSH
jgi:hypothetical protein